MVSNNWDAVQVGWFFAVNHPWPETQALYSGQTKKTNILNLILTLLNENSAGSKVKI
jgi:hypothetical protein